MTVIRLSVSLKNTNMPVYSQHCIHTMSHTCKSARGHENADSVWPTNESSLLIIRNVQDFTTNQGT